MREPDERSFVEAVHGPYAELDHHLLPFIGAAFERPRFDDLRVVVVGINSYVSADDWSKIQPDWYSVWFRNSEHRFFRAARKHATALVTTLRERGVLAPSHFEWPGSFYGTNAIKTYLPQDRGKRSDEVPASLFEQHAIVWRAELDAMAEHAVLPHVVVVFGEPFWAHAVASLRPPHVDRYEHLQVQHFRHATGPSLHFVNRFRVAGTAGEQTMLLVRLRHPSARTKIGSVEWLVANDDFWDVVTNAAE